MLAEKEHLDYILAKLFNAVRLNCSQEGLVIIALYLLGEYGDKLLEQSNIICGGEEIHISESDLISLLTCIFDRYENNQQVNKYLMNCVMKLHDKLASKSAFIHFIKAKETSYDYEIQERAFEYSVLIASDTRKLLENVPSIASIPAEQIEFDGDDKEEEEDEMDLKLKVEVARNINKEVKKDLFDDIFASVRVDFGSSAVNLAEDIFEEKMKIIHETDEIRVGMKQEIEGSEGKCTFYVSNKSSSKLENVQVILAVKKNITMEILATYGDFLEAWEENGVKKEVSLVNNEPDKKLVIKLKISYVVAGEDRLTEFTLKDF